MSEPKSMPQLPSDYRQLAHDIKSQLAVVSLGMEALKGVRSNADEFASVMESIRRDGVEPLKQSVSDLVRWATNGRAS
jgi:hypothetical protein